MRHLIDLVEAAWRRPRKLPPSLFHGTSFYGAASIMHSDTLHAQDDDEINHSGVSLSHRFDIARGYSVEAEFRQRRDLCWTQGKSTFVCADALAAIAPQKGVVLVFSGDGIATNHDHVVLRYGGSERPEVRVLGALHPMSRSLTEVRFDDADARWWLEQYRALSELPPLTDKAAQGWREELIETIPHLEALMHHPLRKPMGA